MGPWANSSSSSDQAAPPAPGNVMSRTRLVARRGSSWWPAVGRGRQARCVVWPPSARHGLTANSPSTCLCIVPPTAPCPPETPGTFSGTVRDLSLQAMTTHAIQDVPHSRPSLSHHDVPSPFYGMLATRHLVQGALVRTHLIR